MTQSAIDVVDVISGMTLFSDLSRPQLESVSHIFEEQAFGDGQHIVKRGFAGSGFFVIIEGRAAVRVNDREIDVLSRGDFFGEISLLLGESPSADVIALGELRCLVLAGSELKDFLETYPKVMYRMLQVEAMRLRKTAR